MRRAERLNRLPPYLFVEMARAKAAARAAGREVLDLGIGDPEEPTPSWLVEVLRQAAGDARHHRYLSPDTEMAFQHAAAGWLRRRHGVEVDPAGQILPVIGTKEGLGHLPLALVDPGDGVLVPDPGYPVYAAAAALAGAEITRFPLAEEDGFRPRLEELRNARTRAARLLFLNYPNNPTGATVDAGFFRGVVSWAEAHGVTIAHDAAYAEITFDGYRAPSLLAALTPAVRAVEFHSLSKTWNMCGWRVGFAAGDAETVAALRQLKSNLDSGGFGAVLAAATAALASPEGPPPEAVAAYERRRDLLLAGLEAAGWIARRPRGAFYVWARPPAPASSLALARELLARLDVATAPGVGFGPGGEGYVRFSLTARTEIVERAAERLAGVDALDLARECAAV